MFERLAEGDMLRAGRKRGPFQKLLTAVKRVEVFSSSILILLS